MKTNLAEIAFYAWWLLVNGFVYYSELHFISPAVRQKVDKTIISWLIINTILTIVTMYYQLSGMLFIHIALLYVFTVAVLKIYWVDSIAPITIILTLNTFTEGFSALFMSFIASNVTSMRAGILIQALISFLLAVLFYRSLIFISKRYLITVHQEISSYLYILLLPCVFFILIIRYGLRLDSHDYESYLSGFGVGAGIASFIIICWF